MGGSGAARKRKITTETPQQQTVRCEKRNKRRRTILGVQGATQRLNHVIYGTDVAEESAWVQQKDELDLFFGAVVKAGGVLGQQGKFLAVQNQYARVGAVEIRRETDNTDMRNLHKEVVCECAAKALARIQLTNKHSVSASHAHKLETHTQRTFMVKTSFNRDSNVILLHNASVLPVDGWSVLNPSLILADGDRVVVTTMTVSTKATPASWPSRRKHVTTMCLGRKASR